MRATLDIDEKIAEKLRELAVAEGVSVDQLLATYIPGLRLANGNGNGAEDTVSAFENWAESFPQNAPLLSNEAISRASIYGDRK
jgi:hypothetical protein